MGSAARARRLRARLGGSDGPRQIAAPDPNDPNNPNNPNKPSCEPGTPVAPPITPRLRRLTFEQYDRTISALVGLELTPSTELGPQIEGITQVLWAGLGSAAERTAAQVVQDQQALMGLLSCDPGALDDACVRTFIQDFGRRAFRRPISDVEQERYASLYAARAELTENGSPLQGLQVVLEAFLQSPNLLLRVERAALDAAQSEQDRILLSGYEMATRLSYGLWNGPPDDALLDAAGRGDLDTPEGLRREAERMLEGAGGVRARALVRASHQDWLGMVGAYAHFWSNTQRDPELFPSFYPGIDFELREEMLRFIEHVVFEENGGFAALLTSPTAVVNDRTAPLYGLSGEFTEAWTPCSWTPTRPGLLTRAGFLGTPRPLHPRLIDLPGRVRAQAHALHRPGLAPGGRRVHTAARRQRELRTTRERIEAMTSGPGCSNCHVYQVNPAGFAFESFDGLGGYRAEENGVPVDTTGTMTLDWRRAELHRPHGLREHDRGLLAGRGVLRGAFR